MITGVYRSPGIAGKVMTGLLKQQHGSTNVDNVSIEAIKVVRRPRLVIYMGQVSYLQFFQPTIADEIRLAIKMAREHPQNIDEAYRRFDLPNDRHLQPMDLSYPAMWRLQLLLLSVIFNPSVLFIDEIIAPNARSQIESLKAVLRDRSDRGQVTIIAYQRLLILPGVRNLQLREGHLDEI